MEGYEEKIILCPRCEGTGYYKWIERVTVDDDETHYRICPTCKGHRVIVEVTEVTHKLVSEDEIKIDDLLKTKRKWK